MVTDEIERLDASWDKWAGADNGDALLDMLRECLEALTERARNALELRFREEHTRSAIARSSTDHGAWSKEFDARQKTASRLCRAQESVELN